MNSTPPTDSDQTDSQAVSQKPDATGIDASESPDIKQVTSDTNEKRISSKAPKWLLLPPLAIGAAVCFYLINNIAGVEKAEVKEAARVLNVVTVQKTEVTPRAIGYGTSMPGQIWQAVAEVRGRIIEIHPDLASGAIIPKDTVLLRIDKRDYELSLAASQSSINQIKAQQAELKVQEANTQASLRIEERSLALAEAALVRKQGLLKDKAIAPDVVDSEERAVLAQRQSVQSLKNTLALIPSQKQSLEANLASTQAQMDQTKRDLERVTIRAPFACRLGPVTLEEDQFVAAGQTLFEAYSLKVTEVEARFPAQRLIPLLSNRSVNFEQLPQMDAMAAMRSVFDLDVTVRISGTDDLIPWTARFERLRESVDPQTRTIGVVVAVDDPYKKVIPGRRPPLSKDVYCEVELKAKSAIERIVIPSAALVGDGSAVFIVNEESRLARREVTTGFTQGTLVTIESGLSDGDQVLTREPVPAIEGMLIEPKVDEVVMARLKKEASGEGDIK